MSAIRPLFIVHDVELLDDLLRLAIAAGVTPQVAHDITAARPYWVDATAVVVDPKAAAIGSQLGLPWRPGLIVAGRGGSTVDSELHKSLWQLASEIGADHVAVLPDAEAWLIDRLGRPPARAAQRAHIVGVVGGRGGAGASTLAAALAITATYLGQRALLVDADPLGSGLDLTLGREDAAGTRWPELAASADLSTTTGLFDGLPRVGELSVLSWDRNRISAIPVAAMNAALDVASSSGELVVVDLPRYPDEASTAALARCDSTLLVVPAEVRAAFAAARVAALLHQHSRQIECVVRGPAPGQLRATDVAQALRLPLAGDLKPEPRLSVALEHGTTPALLRRGPLSQLSRQLLTRWRVGHGEQSGRATDDAR